MIIRIVNLPKDPREPLPVGTHTIKVLGIRKLYHSNNFIVDAELVGPIALVNKHQDHEATCICCKHLDSFYEGDYSDETPGVGFVCNCKKGHFDISEHYSSTYRWHYIFPQGRTCKDFEGRT